MKVVVDWGLCQDHGQCVFAAPEVFRLDHEGHLEVISDTPDAQLRDRVEEAVDSCPVQALRIGE